MPFIDRDFINDLPNRVDIVGLINKRVALKKAGKDYKACCPFHEEKTPSFTVVPTKQIYHCFGCGESGGIIDFIMKYDHLAFVEAIETGQASLEFQLSMIKLLSLWICALRDITN